jgi:hypothetical protein
VDLTDDQLIAPVVMSRYRQMGVMKGWGRREMVELAALARRTPEEIGVFATLSPGETRQCLKKDHFSPAVTLHLMAFRQVIREVKFNEPSVPLVPLDLIWK